MVAGQTNRSGAAHGGTNQYSIPGQATVPGQYTSPGPPVQGTPGDGYGNVPAYRTPSPNAENGYMDSPGGNWSAQLRSFPGGTPDPMRTREMPTRDYRPTPLNEDPAHWWLGQGPGREEQVRHNNNEFVDADGWELQRGASTAKRAAPDPRRTPPPESRATQRMSPNNYVFTRPFDQHAAHRLTGDHFSLADHRRNYPILGMAPVFTRRNTYRADPAPWDVGIVDYPDNSSAYTGSGQIRSVNVQQNDNRAHRLM